MTLAEAQAAANNLRTALLDNGVARVSIELQQGVSGSGWGVAPFKRVLGHHVASYPPGTPGLGIVKGGRGAPNPLDGPLANCYGGFDLTARIVTLGWANHPGTGGPWAVPGWGTVPKDNGRPYILGWEFEGGYLPYTDEMHEFMARCGAGSLDWLGTLPGNPGPAPLECFDEHKGWAGPRKPDRIGYTTASGRARIAAVRGTDPQKEFLMALSDADQAKLLQQSQRQTDILERLLIERMGPGEKGIPGLMQGRTEQQFIAEIPMRVWQNPLALQVLGAALGGVNVEADLDADDIAALSANLVAALSEDAGRALAAELAARLAA